MSDLLKEAIADAQLVRETALANAKLALQEAFEPKLQSMLTQKLREEDAEDSSVNEDESDDGVALSEVIKELEEELDLDEDVAEVTESTEEVSESTEEVTESEEEVTESTEEVSESKDDDDSEEEEVTESKYDDDSEEEEVSESKDDDDSEEEEVSESKDDEEIDIEIEDDEEDVSESKDDEEIDIEIEDDEEDVSEEVTLEDILKEADDIDEELDIEIEEDVEASDTVSESDCDDDDLDLDEVLDAIREDESVDESGAEIATLKEQNETLKTENAEFRKVYKYLRGKLNEVNLLNAKLLYTNKLFKEFKLNNAQKVKVVETFDLTESVREAKLVYSTLGESFKLAEVSVKKPAKTQEITEGLASAKVESTKPAKEILSEGNDMAARFKKLAGITKS